MILTLTHRDKQKAKKLPKQICAIQFENKVLETIRLPQSFSTPDDSSLSPVNLQTNEEGELFASH